MAESEMGFLVSRVVGGKPAAQVRGAASPTPPTSLGTSPERVTVAEASRRERQPIREFQANVQLTGVVSELRVRYLEDSSGTRFSADDDTVGGDALRPGVVYLALVNEEGYAVRILGSAA